MSKARTAADFLADLAKADQTLADWCRKNGFSQALASRVLKSPTAGRWGESRRIAKAMGLALPAMQAGNKPRAAAVATAG